MDFRADRVKELTCGNCGASLDPSSVKPLSKVTCDQCGHETTVPAGFGEVLLTGVLGTGSAGVVCKGLDEKLHRQVAVKILRTEEDSQQLVEACQREARALARLNDPNVVQVYTIGEHRGQPYIVMELLDGGCAEKDLLGEKIDEPRALDVAISVAKGLRAATEVRLVHMDVKPGNILFDRQGRAKLIDFGVANYARDGGDKVVGTPYYVAPEVVRGHPVTHQADIYSLGATLFHLLAGRPPFTGKNVTQVISRRLREAPPDVRDYRPDLHAATAETIHKMLAADPAARHQNYDELLEELERARRQLEQGEGVAIDAGGGEAASESATASMARTAVRSVRRGGRRIGVPIGAAAVLVVLAVVGYSVMRGGGGPMALPDPIPAPPSDTDNAFTRSDEWRVLRITGARSIEGAKMQPLGDGSILVQGPLPERDTYVVRAETEMRRISAVGLEAKPHPALRGGGPGRTGRFVLTGLRVEAAPLGEPKNLSPVSLEDARTDRSAGDGSVGNLLDSDATSGWQIPAAGRGEAHLAAFHTGRRIGHEGGTLLRITLEHHPEYRQFLGRFRLWVSNATPPPTLSNNELRASRKTTASRGTEQSGTAYSEPRP